MDVGWVMVGWRLGGMWRYGGDTVRLGTAFRVTFGD